MTTSTVDLAPQQQLTDGEWSVPTVDLGADLTDPNTGAPIQRQRQTADADVERAIAAAAALHERGDWRRTPAAERAAVLRRAAELIEGDAAEIARADALNSGVVESVTTLFAQGLSGALQSAADHVVADDGARPVQEPGQRVTLRYLPWGPAAVIAPWNAPSFVLAKKTAYALAAGAPVIAKPSNWAPTSATLVIHALAAALAEAGLPPAILQLVHGGADVGRQLAGDPRIRALSFTGGRAGGVDVARTAAADCKALQLELGSNNPVIVRADADIDTTADALVAGFTKLNGQWCESPGSVAVVGNRHRDLVDALLDRLRALRIGHCLDGSAQFGPQAHTAQYRYVGDAVDRLAAGGGTVHEVTARPDLPGWFRAPVVVDGAPAELTRDELFGPVLTLHRVADDGEALTFANSRNTGLAGYVFGTDIDAALALGAEMDCGEVKINGTSVLDLVAGSTQAFWGASGVGAHGDAELLQFFRGARIVGTEAPGRPI